ncbi:MAG TPA: two-component regulator propeller domain-containing protein [Candidatus Angelobacter sp.]
MAVYKNFSSRLISTAFWILLALGLSWLSSLAWARGATNQMAEYIHSSWRSEDGLPQNSVMAILQTGDGYLWLGTQEGLVRFNGVQFKVFDKNNDPAFKVNDIRALLQDRQGDLWIGSFGGGLIQYHGGIFRSYRREDGLSDNSVLTLLEDRDGGLWVGTTNGLNRFKDNKFVAFGKDAGLSDVVINVLAQDREGDLWVGTNNGLNRILRSEFQHPRIAKFLDGKPIKSLYVGPSGDLWAGTQTSGIYRFSFRNALPNTGQSESVQATIVHYGTREGLPESSVRAVLDEGNMVWAGTDNGGLCRLFLTTGNRKFECYTARDGLTGNSVASIFRDRERSLWVGTSTGGLNQFKAGALSVFAHGDNPDDAARSIHEGRDGSLWVAMDSGLHRYNEGHVRVYRTDKGPANNDAWSVIEDRDGNVWVGTKGGGLNEVIGNSIKTYTTRDGLADNQIYAVLQDHTGDIWIGTLKGLSRLHQGKFTNYTKRDGLSGQYVWCIHEDHAHDIWIGTEGGMSLFRDGKFTNFNFKTDASWVGGVTYIYEDQDHVLWLGTDASGLKRFKNGKFTTYTSKDGMFDDTVWAILEDDQSNFWMSSNHGIFRVPKRELTDFADGRRSQITSISYGPSDGMPSTECNGDSQSPALKTRDGKLLFACVRGVVAVNPRNVSLTLPQPQVVIESALANKQPLAREARLPAGRGDLSFDFAVLSYASAANFKYKLEGYKDDRWTEPNAWHEANYTNIPPGEYTFRVIASNNHEMWSPKEASIHFYLIPRFYQTTWFYLICALGILGLAAAAYLLRIREIRKRQQDLLILVNERTKELQQEVRQRQRAEEALSRTAAIVESSSDAIWSIDRDGKIVTWNSGAEKLFGYTAAESVGHPAILIVPPERSWELEHYLSSMLEGEPVTNLETVRRRKDGSLVDVSLSRSPMLKDGKVVAVSVIALDISERKKAEEALQHAKDAAESATQAKSEFLANMSHEIRTPLNGVIGTLELAGHTQLTAEQGELLAMARDSANTLLVLINDILDFSKIEAGKLQFDLAEFDLREMIAGAMRNMVLRADEKQLVLSYSIASEVPQFVVGDAVRLQQVLTNLLGNAVKFTQRGQIVVAAEPDGMNGGEEHQIRFSVRDTGIGIPREKQQVIFEAFSQADASTTRRFGGTGLGLAICSRIVALMGGRIWVESEPGKGSTFWFTARFKMAAPSAAAANADANGHHGLEHSEKLKILVAEDNLVNQKVAVRILESAGHQVAVANSGREALERLQELPVDLILMDLQMPEMDGFAATRAIREKEKTTGLHVSIIAMTAHAMKGDREICLQTGMDEYISKPVDSNGLLQLIARVMHNRDQKNSSQACSTTTAGQPLV